MKNILIAMTLIFITMTACSESSAIAASLSTPAPKPALSTPIQDPLLLQAWTKLNSLTEAVQLADGKILTGHELAQFIVEKNIPIVWDEANDCKGSSCSIRICAKNVCTHDNSGTTPAPIYMMVSLKENAASDLKLLVEPMAHEIYHRMQPFGETGDSLYEEYWAYQVGVQIAKTGWIKSNSIAPLQPACLKRWFEDQGLLYAYTRFPDYPTTVLASVDTTGQDCTLKAAAGVQPAPEVEVTAQPETKGDTICQANSLGLIDCQKVTPAVVSVDQAVR
jgi:hypothetical protein